MRRFQVCVVGGVNVDITGTSDGKLLHGDSNPGQVAVSLGGVGRNIAENLARLGVETQLVCCLGQDGHLDSILNHCAQVHIGLELAEVQEDLPNGCYLCVNDADGDLYAAVNDMRVCQRMTPQWLQPRLNRLNQADLVVADANLPEESIAYLAERLTVPLVADPVSIRKAERLRGALPYLSAIKPNRAEAELLSGVPIHGTQGLDAAAEALLTAGVQRVLITLGSQGVYFADDTHRGIQPALTGEMVSTNGCGDAFLSAAILGLLQGRDIRHVALMGQAASALCARSAGAVNPDMSEQAILQLAQAAGEPIGGN